MAYFAVGVGGRTVRRWGQRSAPTAWETQDTAIYYREHLCLSVVHLFVVALLLTFTQPSVATEFSLIKHIGTSQYNVYGVSRFELQYVLRSTPYMIAHTISTCVSFGVLVGRMR